MKRAGVWIGAGVAAVIAAIGLQAATPVLAAAPVAPSITVTPSTAAPGRSLTLVLHMQSIPSNFAFPACAVVDLLSNVVLPGDASGGLLAVATVNGPGDFSAVAVIPAAAPPGTYTVQARACGIVWASATFQVTMPMPATGAGLETGRLSLAALLLVGGTLLVLTTRGRRLATTR